MISELLAAALLTLPCNSDVRQEPGVTVVSRCALPSVQGPPRPPLGWTVVDRAHKPKFKYPSKKKRSSKRGRKS